MVMVFIGHIYFHFTCVKSFMYLNCCFNTAESSKDDQKMEN